MGRTRPALIGGTVEHGRLQLDLRANATLVFSSRPGFWRWLQHLNFQELQVTDSSQRQKPGPGKPLTAQRELYFRLMKQGLNNSEACRLVGIHRKTGQRWRHGRRHRARGREYYYRPITAPPPTVSARFLSEDERIRIADLYRLGWSKRAIARKLGRDPSTIS